MATSLGLSRSEMQVLARHIDRVPQLRSFGIAFVGRGMSQIVRQPAMPNGLATWVVLKERNMELFPVTSSTVPAAPTPSESNLGGELLMAGLSCGAAFFAGVAGAAGVAAAPVTGGASAALTVVVWAGSAATAAQCGMSTGRVLNEIFDPRANEILDSDPRVQRTSAALDAISVAGGVASLGQAAQVAIRLSRTSGRPLTQILKGMNRAERKRLAQDIARYTKTAATRRQFIRLARAGKVEKVFSTQRVNKAVLEQLLSSVSAGLTMIGSGSKGVIREVVVHLVEEN